MVRTCVTTGRHYWRMLKKARRLTRATLAVISPSHPESAKTDSSPWDAPCSKQGRSKRRSGRGTDRTSWGRSPMSWILANGKPPPAFPPSVEGLRDARTLPGERLVSARRGWAGEMSDSFSIRLKLVERLILQDCECFRCVRDSQHDNRTFPLSRRGAVAAFNIDACLRQQIRHFF